MEKEIAELKAEVKALRKLILNLHLREYQGRMKTDAVLAEAIIEMQENKIPPH